MATVAETWQGIVAKTWEDEEFKQRPLDEPGTVLAENGINLPRGVHPVIVENEPSRVHFVLVRPTEEYTSEGAENGASEALMEYNAAFS